MDSIQTHFTTTFSPVHFGHQDALHRDVHHHLADPTGKLVMRAISQDNHRPVIGQTTLNDFRLERRDGIW